MRRFILTGTPGCGKTSVIKALEITGASVVKEAATDIIASQQRQGIENPWEEETFIDPIVKLQKNRQLDVSVNYSDLCCYDRSPVCTYALAVYLNLKPSDNLIEEVERIKSHGVYDKTVFFIDNLGFIENTNARQISFADSLEFEKNHLDTYAKFGFNCLHIPAGTIKGRVKLILKHIEKSA